MARQVLTSSENQIKGIAVWGPNDKYPDFQAGSQTPANADDGVTTVSSNTGINANWIRIRNFVNKLRNDIDTLIQTTLPDATTDTPGKVSILSQVFGGKKMFPDGVESGSQASKSGIFRLWHSAHSFFVSLVFSGSATDNRYITFPDKTGTVALTSDLTSKQDVLTDDSTIPVKKLTVGKVLDTNGEIDILNATNDLRVTIRTTTPVSTNKTITFPDISGQVVIKDAGIKPPLNFRIIDMPSSSIPVSYLPSDQYGDAVLKRSIVNFFKGGGLPPQKALIRLAWNYNTIVGTGGDGVFTITSSPTFTSNQLAGYYLNIPSQPSEFKITANQATSGGQTILTITNLDDSASNLTGVTVATPHFARIHCGADYYRVVGALVNFGTGGEEPTRTSESVDGSQDSVDLSMHSGFGYNFYIAAYNANGKSETASLISGAFNKFGQSVPFANPFIVKLPDISSNGAAVSVSSSKSGFKVNITGWSEATAFEIAFTELPTGATFALSDESTQRIIVHTRSIDVPINKSARYNVKVRPIFGGQAVADYLPNYNEDPSVGGVWITTGTAGEAPNDQKIASVQVALKTYSGSMSASGSNWALSNIRTPAGGDVVVSALDSSIEGDILIDSVGKEFVISRFLGGNTISLVGISGQTGNPTAGTFQINTSKRGRLLHKILLPIDYELTDSFVDCDAIPDGSVVIRVYQEIAESSADSVVVSQGDQGYPLLTDVQIRSQFGARYLVIDAYDPNNLLNGNTFVGTVTINGRAIYSQATAVTNQV